MTHLFGRIVLLLAIAAVGVGAAPYAMASPSTIATGKSTMTLCASAGATTGEMLKDKVRVARRVRHGFHFHTAVLSLSGTCVSVTLPRPIAWLRWLADDLASDGRFGIGVAYPSAKSTLTPGENVRYTSDPPSSATAKLPEVKVVLGRPSFLGWSAKVLKRGNFDYVGVRLTASGSTKLCTFTQQIKGGLAVVVLDHQVITQEQVNVQICGGKLLTGFPTEKSLDKPLGPRELAADLKSGPPLPAPLAVSSLS